MAASAKTERLSLVTNLASLRLSAVTKNLLMFCFPPS
jgi:hypothetical protein